MSIINDALKKAQKGIEKNAQKNAASHNPSDSPHSSPINSTDAYAHLVKDTRKHKYQPAAEQTKPQSAGDQTQPGVDRTAMMIISFFLVLMVVLVIIFWNIVKSNQDTGIIETRLNLSAADSLQAQPLPQAEALQESAHEEISTPVPRQNEIPAGEPLILSGTMMMGNERVAIINDDVYEVGESIQGKKIINITLKKVDLIAGGKITTLFVKGN
ncbi:MAG: hypothetical protein KC713_01845 [Candidatus Omnitrophica bacterium]|nr:hypothetical protein [Candidatus Omnitrophota bacterium]